MSARSSSAMSLEEYIILPTSHSQQNFAEQGEMMPVFGVDCDLSCGAKRDLIVTLVVGNVDDSHRTTSSRPRFRFDERG